MEKLYIPIIKTQRISWYLQIFVLPPFCFHKILSCQFVSPTFLCEDQILLHQVFGTVTGQIGAAPKVSAAINDQGLHLVFEVLGGSSQDGRM